MVYHIFPTVKSTLIPGCARLIAKPFPLAGTSKRIVTCTTLWFWKGTDADNSWTVG